MILGILSFLPAQFHLLLSLSALRSFPALYFVVLLCCLLNTCFVPSCVHIQFCVLILPVSVRVLCSNAVVPFSSSYFSLQGTASLGLFRFLPVVSDWLCIMSLFLWSTVWNILSVSMRYFLFSRFLFSGPGELPVPSDLEDSPDLTSPHRERAL